MKQANQDHLKDIRSSLSDLKKNSVTKRDLLALMAKVDGLERTLRSYFDGRIIGATSAENSQSILEGPYTSFANLDIPKNELFVIVEDGGKTHKLELPRSVILHIEASRSKRGVVRKVLSFVHPIPGYFDNRTLTGHGGNNRKSPKASDELEPLPPLTVKYCIAAVNRVMPLDVSRFQESVVAEERKKYDKETREEIGRAIIDLRKEKK